MMFTTQITATVFYFLKQNTHQPKSKNFKTKFIFRHGSSCIFSTIVI